jgi:F0F1-type ATP synthase delta subunit
MTRLTRRQLASIWLTLAKKYDHQKAVALFSELIIQERRQREVDYIVDTVRRIEYEQTGEATVDVTTARPVDSIFLEKITKTMQHITRAQNVKIKHHINRHLIGGFVAQSDGVFFDASTKRLIRELENV